MGIFGSGRKRGKRVVKRAEKPMVAPPSLRFARFGPRPPLPDLPPEADQAIQREIGRSGFAEIGESLGWTRGQAWTIYHTYVCDRYAEGRLRQGTDPDIGRVMKAIQITEVQDSDANPFHLRVSHVVAPIENLIWRVLRPPMDWGCRCSYRLISTMEVGRLTGNGYERHGDIYLPHGMDIDALTEAVKAIAATWADGSPWDDPIPEFKP